MTTIARPKGFTTVTLFHDTKASRKSDRAWKVTIPVNEHATEAVRLNVFDGYDNTNGMLDFDAALSQATEVVTEALGIEPEWSEGTDWQGVRTARWELP